MGSVITFVLFGLLIAFVGDVAASCNKIANDEMLEYFCEGGQPTDLATIPETAEKIRIIRMPIRRITADTFSRFGGNLWVLSCSHCEITDIDPNAFRSLVNLQQLSLDSNHLSNVRESWFEGLNYLTFLDLNYNNIRNIEDGVYKNLPSLVDFRLSGNQLQCLNLDGMSHLKDLKRMFLSENPNFACPHAITKFLTNYGVNFEQDPEWRKIVADTIDVYVPPNYVEQDKTTPTYRDRLHQLSPDRRPSPQESEKPYIPPAAIPEKDRMFYPDHRIDHHAPHRRPPSRTTVRTTTLNYPNGMHLPRVEPRFPSQDTKAAYVSRKPEQIVPESTAGTSRITHLETKPTTEDGKRSETGETSQAERILTYPSYVATHEATPWYPTSERSQIPPIKSGSSAEDETVSESYDSEEEIVTYPLYDTTFDYQNGISTIQNQPSRANIYSSPRGSIQIARPSSSYPDSVTSRVWSTDTWMEQPTYPSWTQNREYEQSRDLNEKDRSSWQPTKIPDHQETPYFRGYTTSRGTMDEWLSNTDNSFVSTDYPVEHSAVDESEVTKVPFNTKEVHYVRPLPPLQPELVHPVSTDHFYQAPFYESTVTLHPPLQNYQERKEMTTVATSPYRTPTSEPKDLNKNLSPRTQPITTLLISGLIIIFEYVILGGF